MNMKQNIMPCLHQTSGNFPTTLRNRMSEHITYVNPLQYIVTTAENLNTAVWIINHYSLYQNLHDVFRIILTDSDKVKGQFS